MGNFSSVIYTPITSFVNVKEVMETTVKDAEIKRIQIVFNIAESSKKILHVKSIVNAIAKINFAKRSRMIIYANVIL